MTFRIVNPDALGRPSGWNHGMLAPAAGRLLFVAGQTAPERSGLVEQWHSFPSRRSSDHRKSVV